MTFWRTLVVVLAHLPFSLASFSQSLSTNEGDGSTFTSPAEYFDPASYIAKLDALDDVLTDVYNHNPDIATGARASGTWVLEEPLGSHTDGQYAGGRWGLIPDLWCWQDTGPGIINSVFISAYATCVHELTHCAQPESPLEPTPVEPGTTGGGTGVGEAMDHVANARDAMDEVEAYMKSFCAVINLVMSDPKYSFSDGARLVRSLKKRLDDEAQRAADSMEEAADALDGLSASQVEEFQDEIDALSNRLGRLANEGQMWATIKLAKCNQWMDLP